MLLLQCVILPKWRNQFHLEHQATPLWCSVYVMKSSKRPLLQQWPKWQQQWPACIWIVPIYKIEVSVFLKHESWSSISSISIVKIKFKLHNDAYQGQYSLSRNVFTSNKTTWCNVLLVIMIGSENIERKWISFPVIVSMTSHQCQTMTFNMK